VQLGAAVFANIALSLKRSFDLCKICAIQFSAFEVLSAIKTMDDL